MIAETAAADLHAAVRATLDRLSTTGALPTLPATATAALSIARDPDAEIEAFCRVARTDVGVAARLLRIANSAVYARRTVARTLEDAVVTIGLAKACDLLVAASARQLYAQDGMYAEALWQHALATAIAAEELARRLRTIAPPLAFLPGLFHDVGRIGFLMADPLSFAVIHDLAERGTGERTALEREWYDFDHAEAGAALAADWGLDPAQVDAIRSHHGGESGPVGRPLPDLIAAADALAWAIGCGGPGQPPEWNPIRLGLSLDDAEACRARVRELFDAQCALLA